MSHKLANLDARTLKAGGFIRQREKDVFVARIRVAAGNIDADKMIEAAQLAKKYGRGYCHFTFQQSIEIPWVKLEDFEDFKRDLEAAGLGLANCGPKVRAITACSGCQVNPYGVVDAAGLAARADERFFGLETPHKFKIAYAGCPIGCPNPQGNDLGFHGMVEPDLNAGLCNGCSLCVTLCRARGNGALSMNEKAGLPERDPAKCVYCGECIICCPTDAWRARRVGHAVYVGGKHGRFPRWANRVADFVSDEDTFKLIERTVQWYRDNGKKGERLGNTIDRVGLDRFQTGVLGVQFATAHQWNSRGDRPMPPCNQGGGLEK